MSIRASQIDYSTSDDDFSQQDHEVVESSNRNFILLMVGIIVGAVVLIGGVVVIIVCSCSSDGNKNTPISTSSSSSVAANKFVSNSSLNPKSQASSSIVPSSLATSSTSSTVSTTKPKSTPKPVPTPKLKPAPTPEATPASTPEATPAPTPEATSSRESTTKPKPTSPPKVNPAPETHFLSRKSQTIIYPDGIFRGPTYGGYFLRHVSSEGVGDCLFASIAEQLNTRQIVPGVNITKQYLRSLVYERLMELFDFEFPSDYTVSYASREHPQLSQLARTSNENEKFKEKFKENYSEFIKDDGWVDGPGKFLTWYVSKHGEEPERPTGEPSQELIRAYLEYIGSPQQFGTSLEAKLLSQLFHVDLRIWQNTELLDHTIIFLSSDLIDIVAVELIGLAVDFNSVGYIELLQEGGHFDSVYQVTEKGEVIESHSSS